MIIQLNEMNIKSVSLKELLEMPKSLREEILFKLSEHAFAKGTKEAQAEKRLYENIEGV